MHTDFALSDLSERALECLQLFFDACAEFALHYTATGDWYPVKILSLVFGSTQTNFHYHYGRDLSARQTRQNLIGLPDYPECAGKLKVCTAFAKSLSIFFAQPISEMGDISRYLLMTLMHFIHIDGFTTCYQRIRVLPQWKPPLCYAKYFLKPFARVRGCLIPFASQICMDVDIT